MKRKRIAALILAIVLALALAVPGFAAEVKTEDSLLTRGELVTALYKLSNVPEMEPRQAYFDDVPMHGDLALVIRWAVGAGIVNGYGDGRFGPDDPVTREQMAAMLYRAAQAAGQGFQGTWMFLLDFPDADQVSSWADEAMHWVVMKGIIVGTDKGLEPRATATDDQLSLVLQRWQKSVIEPADSVWYSFDDAAAAIKVPADMEFRTDSGLKGTYIGRNDRLQVLLAKWDRVSAPDIASLAALAAESTGEETEISEQGGLSLVKILRADGCPDYFLIAPNGDDYRLLLSPNTDADPDLTPADVADELQTIGASLCSSLSIPEGEQAVEMLQTAYPETDWLVLVNKLNALPEDWEDELDCVYTTNSMGDDVEVERTAYKAYLALKADLEENDGVYLELDSARRSVAAQQDIMDRFIEKYGADYAAKTVAQPGYSEHHTGLALDLYFRLRGEDGGFTDVYYNEDMVQYPEIWEKVHAKLADYGFILRYLEGREHITGYGYEPWHIRYVGYAETAHEIMAQGLTLEEYLAGEKLPEVAVDYGSSELYTREEMDEAMVQIKCRFAAFEGGCELHSLTYGGDWANSAGNIQWMNELDEGKNYTQVIAFLSDFHSPAAGGGAWETDKEYKDWQWWLARTENGGWQLLTWGYGGWGPAETEGGEEDGQNPVMNFIGNYQAGRARAIVECSGSEDARITIEWGGSAWDLARWVIVGKLDPETLTVNYTGCVKTELTYGDDGSIVRENTVYDDGTGSVVFNYEDSSFTWTEDQSDRGELVFAWVPAVPDEEEDGQNPVMNFIGNYQAGRARAIVECSGSEDARITIEWGGSAWDLARWVIVGKLDPDTLTVNYTGCVMTELTYGDDGSIVRENTVYDDGTGSVVFNYEDSSFTWTEDQSDRGELVFAWVPAVPNEEEDGQNPVMNFIGNYQAGRARAIVECSGSEDARITIEWGGSAWDLARWVIVGKLDPDTLTVNYTGCVMTELTYGDDGSIVRENTVYDDGAGSVVFNYEDSSFTWTEDQSDRGELVFTWVPAE